MPDKDQPGSEPTEQESPKKCILRVKGGTDCQRLAHAIAGVVARGDEEPTLEYIGAGACNQAVKAVGIANSVLAIRGVYLSVVPVFQRRQLAGNDNTVAMQLRGRLHQL